MKKTLENKYFAVFIILTFLIYVMSNGEWCIPIFAWIYPILFLHMLSLNHTRKVYLIIGSIYAIGFVFRFEKAIGMDIKICIMVSFLVAFLKILPYIYWFKSKMRFQDTVIFASIPHFVYSWRLEPTDPQPVGTKLDLSLREKEKLIGYDLDNRLDPLGKI